MKKQKESLTERSERILANSRQILQECQEFNQRVNKVLQEEGEEVYAPSLLWRVRVNR